MASKNATTESVIRGLKNDAVRQRWEMFHRAIALAKHSTHAALDAEQESIESNKATTTVLRVVR
ncbi:MAG TPA: hypothetical protein VIS04_02930 [Woeseiaceae bacterium]|jgi:hypothetical protein